MLEVTRPSVRSQRAEYARFLAKQSHDPEPIKPERAVIPTELPGGPVVNPPTEPPLRDDETKDEPLEQLGLFAENKRP